MCILHHLHQWWVYSVKKRLVHNQAILGVSYTQKTGTQNFVHSFAVLLEGSVDGEVTFDIITGDMMFLPCALQ